MELACHETTCSMVQIPSSASCWFFFTRNLCLEQSWERGSCNALKSWKRAPFLSPLSARARRMSSDMMDVSIREKGRRVKKKFFLLKSDCGLRWNAHSLQRDRMKRTNALVETSITLIFCNAQSASTVATRHCIFSTYSCTHNVRFYVVPVSFQTAARVNSLLIKPWCV